LSRIATRLGAIVSIVTTATPVSATVSNAAAAAPADNIIVIIVVRDC
jgi:hypothetical protein